MKKRFLFFLSIGGILLYNVSCKKGPGLGGEANIKGKINGILYNKNFTVKLDSGYVGNWNVNIIYGNDASIGTSQKTSYDGSFEFPYLRTGHYTIFTYSRAHKTNLVDSSIVFEVDISGKKQSFTLPDIHVFR